MTFLAALTAAMVLPASAAISAGALSALNRNVPEHVLYSFQSNTDGGSPHSTLIANQKGELFGTTEFGGGGCEGGCGTVFVLSPRTGGGYTERILHRFVAANDGTNPEAGLVADASGALYGTTVSGGNACFPPGCGVVFKLIPQANGGYRESILYAFTGGADGGNPSSSLTIDSRGDLVGTATDGSTGGGVVFELAHSGGTYKESVLYTFGKQKGDGTSPSGPVIADGAGNLYGATANGGSASAGTLYELSPTAHGDVETILYNFTGTADGASPNGPLAFGPGGVLYGTAFSGGQGVGVVFALAPNGKGYAESTIHTFTTLGAEPAAGLFVDPHGILYGTTAFGGLPGCTNGGGCGIVFRLTPNNTGFAFDVMHVFGGGRDGSEPLAALIPGTKGELYGTTLRGGTGNYGTVYRIK